ncbi:unnamed protein product [Gadus morhua 'NCC']
MRPPTELNGSPFCPHPVPSPIWRAGVELRPTELGHGPCISPVLWGWQQQQLGCVSLLMDVSDGWCRWPQATIVSGLWLSAERSPEPTTQQQGPPRLQIALALYSPALLARLLALPTRQALSSALFCF